MGFKYPYLLMPNLTTCFFEQQDDVDPEMQRLKLELKQTMEMYNAACQEAPLVKKMVCVAGLMLLKMF